MYNIFVSFRELCVDLHGLFVIRSRICQISCRNVVNRYRWSLKFYGKSGLFVIR